MCPNEMVRCRSTVPQVDGTCWAARPTQELETWWSHPRPRGTTGLSGSDRCVTAFGTGLGVASQRPVRAFGRGDTGREPRRLGVERGSACSGPHTPGTGPIVQVRNPPGGGRWIILTPLTWRTPSSSDVCGLCEPTNGPTPHRARSGRCATSSTTSSLVPAHTRSCSMGAAANGPARNLPRTRLETTRWQRSSPATRRYAMRSDSLALWKGGARTRCLTLWVQTCSALEPLGSPYIRGTWPERSESTNASTHD
jgi:hypothetical protein